MITFKQFLAAQQEICEGLIGTAAMASYAMKSRRQGDDAVSAYRRGQAALSQRRGRQSVDQRLHGIEAALDSLLAGLIKQRAQLGSGIALDVVGHTSTANAMKV